MITGDLYGLETYPALLDQGYDELFDETQAIRPHWLPFLTELDALPEQEPQQRAERLVRHVRKTGIAHDIFADPSARSQRWQLDLAPVIISSAEWLTLDAALVQRARLFDAMLGDLYGDQRVMREGLVPPELVFSDSSYLQACRNIHPSGGQLHFYAADLARGADGQWRVIDNHTETLAGLGFCLANRVVHTHIAGDIFERCNVIRLADHFQRLQNALTAASGRDNAQVALLTPGAHHPDYFSHAYIARYLGYLLVEGRDLVMTAGRVFLKTLEGLQAIDLIVRCVDGRLVDPLELDPGGFEGPAGLLRACRKSPNLVVNAVGTAIAQNRGLGACLPALAKTLLGEDLALPDAPRRWLGTDANRRHVLDQLDSFVIRKTQEGTGRPGQAAHAQDPTRFSPGERDRLAREIELHGAHLVAEEKIGFSTAPAFEADDRGRGGSRYTLVPKPFAVRCFVVRTLDGYRAMPGGLAMTVNPDRAVALSAPDGHTRDVWIVADTPQAPHISLWRPTVETARVDRSQRLVQSRVADDLFWLGRYAERSDWTMRVMRSALRRVAEDNGPSTGRRAAQRCLELLLGTPADALKSGGGLKSGDGPRPSAVATPPVEIEQLLAKLIKGGSSPRTLERTSAHLHRVAHMTRDRLSHEAWQTLSKFGDGWGQSLAAATPTELLDLLDDGLASLSAFNGLMHENMTRNIGWSFLDMGRRLERAYNLAEAILTLFIPRPGDEEEQSRLLLLLEIADSFITYRSRYRVDLMLSLVLDLLLLDETNPRSMAFQHAALTRHMETLPDAKRGGGLSEDRRILLALSTAIRLGDIEALASEASGEKLAALMREQLRLMPDFTSALSSHYFNLSNETAHRVQTRSTPRS